MILLYPSIVSAPNIKQFVIHILPSCLTQTLLAVIHSAYMANNVTHSHHKCISHCFRLQSMPCSLTWKDVYVADKERAIFMQHLIYHQPFDKSTISSLPSQYRSAVANNAFDIFENRLVLYEPVPITINKMCRIVVLFYLMHTIFFLLYASPDVGHVREYKTLYHIKLRFFWPKMIFQINRWIK